MSEPVRNTLLFVVAIGLVALTGWVQGINTGLYMLNLCLLSAIMAIGVNLQWGFAGLFNVGVMGFVALGGLAAVVVSMPSTPGAWEAGGFRVLGALLLGAATIIAAVQVMKRMAKGRARALTVTAVLVIGFFVFRAIFDPGVDAIEDINPALLGYLGGMGLPVIIAWPIGGALAAGAAWLVGKTALGLRSDYLAIATLGIAEITIAVMKNEEWLSRGVKNVVGIPRPVPYEVDLQANPAFVERAESLGLSAIDASTIFVRLCYAGLFLVILLVLLWMVQMALKSPWGRMMRAIRDNEVAAEAMGKDVTRRHLQVFVLGSAICGLAGAMLTTMDSQLVPSSYQPLRFTFVVWVMVIVGGSGNNFGAVLGGFLILFLWDQGEEIGLAIMDFITAWMPAESAVRAHLLESAAHMRLLTIGVILLLVLRFSPRGLIPEK